MTASRPGVAVVRGEALNPFEMQAYARLSDDFEVLMVGRRRPNYEVDALGASVRLLPGTNQNRIVGAAARRIARFDHRADEGRLLGLSRAVAGRRIVHAAETAIPLSHQCAEIAARGGALLVLTCWENIAFRFDENPVTAARKRAVRDACDLFVAVTPSARAALLAEGADPERIVVIPAGVDTERFTPGPPQRIDLRARLGLPPDSLVVLFVGRLIQEKGVVELVQAFARLPADVSGRAVHLVVAGNGPDGPRVGTAAAALGCADRVHLTPGVGYADVPDLHRNADVVVAPSLSTPYWQEQFGMVLVEAMACGRTLITTRSGSIPEVVGDAALLVTPYDVDGLAAALHEVVTDDAVRATYAQRGRALAEERFAVGVVAAQLAAAYRGLLDRR